VKKYAYDEPNKDGSNNHVEMTEQEIIDAYWQHWVNRMSRAIHRKNTKAYGKPELITRENCIDDWVVVNQAYEVK